MGSTFATSSVFSDVGRIKLLIQALINAASEGMLLVDSYYWLDINGEQNDRINNTLMLLEKSAVITLTEEKIYIAELFMQENKNQSIDYLFTKHIVESIEEPVLESIFRHRFIYEDGRIAIKIFDVPPTLIEVRNLLISSNALIQRSQILICSDLLQKTLINRGYYFYLFDSDKEKSEAELLEYLAKNSILGEEAEEIAYQYELSRLKDCELEPRLIAKTNILAGYDIKSLNDEKSSEYDRFIEVKYFNNKHFYISENELQTANKYGDNYWIYLVNTENKKIEQIQNPALVLQDASIWKKNCKVFEFIKIQ